MLFSKENIPDLLTQGGITRRGFLKSGGFAGLAIGFYLPTSRAVANPADVGADIAPGSFAPNAFIRISPDNLVTVVDKHAEMGQGNSTGMATMAADELDADWAQVRFELAPGNPKLYNNLAFGPMQGTGGSSAIANAWMQMRSAGATARAMLVQAAAQTWKLPASEITASKSVLSHASGKRATYGEMASAAALLDVPANVKLKTPAQFTIIGKNETRRLDSPAKCTGKAIYTIDVKLPGLLTAVIARPPAFGATLKSFDASAAKKVPGVTDVVQVPEGVAVVANGMWPALKGRKALRLEWDFSGAETRSSAGLLAEYRQLAATPGSSARKDGDPAVALASAAHVVEAVYEFPYLAHAPMEPLNCVAWLHDGIVETWSGHQFHSFDQLNAAKAAGLPPDKVKLNTLLSGGSFGRRANFSSDFVVEAVNVAKALGRSVPVRVQRTREDDMRAGFYRPAYVHSIKAGLDSKGQLIAWQQTVVGQSIAGGSVMESAMVKNGVDATSVEGAVSAPYAIPNFSVDLHTTKVGVPPLWWRSVGSTHTAYVVETMIDEMATAAGQDPVAFRLAMLKDEPRHANVLRLVAEKSGWGGPLPPGRARGVALAESFKTYVAQVVEVSLCDDGLPRVERVFVAVDCGVPVNPNNIRSQMEGGVGYALAAILYSAIDLKDGAAVQGNFDTYKALRMDAMPAVEVHIVASEAPPTGVGEPGVPPLAPALANAVAKLTGKRVRSLPFSRQKLFSA